MPIERRALLRMATASCLYCLGGGTSHAESGHGPHWSYDGATGPEHWGELSPAFKVCQLGLEQTPIDLTTAVQGSSDPVALDYRALPVRIINNGHTIQVDADSGCSCTIGGASYQLVQFHFHHPSEHLLDGRAFAMEVHFVHKSTDGALAVIGVFVEPGAYNSSLQLILDQMPQSSGSHVTLAGVLDPGGLLPISHAFFRYRGSLTTPPCSEGLTWTVFRNPIEASPDQIRQFAALFPNNSRPVQPRHRRFLIETL